MDDFQLKRQLELEKQSEALGVKRYRDTLEKTPLSEMQPGMALTKMAIEPLAAAIRVFCIPRKSGAKLMGSIRFITLLDAETVAFLTAKRIINSFGKGNEPLQLVAVNLASMLREEIDYRQFKLDHPGFLYKVEENLKHSTTPHRRRVITRAKNQLKVNTEAFTEVDRAKVGLHLIELFIATTGMAEVVDDPAAQRSKKKHPMKVVIPSKDAADALSRAHAKCELLAPVHYPMVIPPKDWGTAFGGGFYSAEAGNLTSTGKLVKTWNSEYLNKLSEAEMPLVYSALNTLQNTPWRINRRVYETLSEIWNAGGTLGDLPDAEEEPLPPQAWEKNETPDPQILKLWKRKASECYVRNICLRSKRIGVKQKLHIANKMLNEPEIFFVWTMDFRGRLYPTQSYINPQADDSGRALIEFAQGVELGDRGAFWLAVHGANTFGMDKVSFEDRVQWVEEHTAQILDSAGNPLDGARFWCGADDPYQFLAFCFEWAEMIKLADRRKFESHICVGMDGSCNGLQHFSMMLRDPVGGEFTNLVPGGKPRDIYQEVADILNRIVNKDAAEGNEWARIWQGKINRKVTKRGVMTTPYGSKRYGLRAQLKVELAKIDRNYLGVDDDFPAIHYLSKQLFIAIREVVVAAGLAMDWLQSVARIMAKANLKMTWTTPVAFPVSQDYRDQHLTRIDTIFGGIRLVLGLTSDTEDIAPGRMINGIAPNLIHSMDAAHLMLTVNKATAEGLNAFGTVHDSYGTHAGNTPKLNALLREAFIEMYAPNLLAEFRDELFTQLTPELQAEIPPLPPLGDLDPAGIFDSQYFYA